MYIYSRPAFVIVVEFVDLINFFCSFFAGFVNRMCCLFSFFWFLLVGMHLETWVSAEMFDIGENYKVYVKCRISSGAYGPMDKAPDFGSGDSRFDPWWARFHLFDSWFATRRGVSPLCPLSDL